MHKYQRFSVDSDYIFSMFEAFFEDINLDKGNFDERYGKSFYEAIDNFEASVSIG